MRGTRFNTGDGIRMALDIGAVAGRQLVRLPRRRLGPQRARVRRPRGRRRLPEAQLSVRRHGQRRRQALRRRGRRLPQLHLRQIRPRDPGAAGPVRLAGLRQQGRCTCCATSTASSRSPRCTADTLEELAAKLEGVDADGLPRRDRAPTTPRCAPTCRSTRTSRTAAAPMGLAGAEVELGQHARRAALRGLPGHLRHHLHLRRPAHRHRHGAGAGQPTCRRSPASTRRASWSAACSTSTIRAAPA